MRDLAGSSEPSRVSSDPVPNGEDADVARDGGALAEMRAQLAGSSLVAELLSERREEALREDGSSAGAPPA